jgi:adenylate cyclase
LRLLPNIRYGTERYPEKIARRLRAVNITMWCVALVVASFALVRFFDPVPGRWQIALVTFAASVVFASLPLLHRFGPLAAPLAFITFSYAFIFWVSWIVGTGSGAYLYYLTAAALGVLYVGTERTLIAAVLTAVAAALIIAVHAAIPHSTGMLADSVLLYTNFAVNAVASAAIVFAVVHYAVREIARAEATAEREHQRSDSLLVNILPPRVAARLKDRADAEIADAYAEASVLFADMAGFTARAGDTEPRALVRFLNEVFSRLDALVERHGLEKIKTTGDAYMVVSGVPEPRADHAEALAELALDMRDALAGLVDPKGRAVPVRIGLASGPVVAGVVGTKKFFYDVWGDAVNVAARMEQTGEAGRIQVSPEAHERLEGAFALAERGVVEVRGKGTMRTWFLEGRKAALRGEPPAPPGRSMAG